VVVRRFLAFVLIAAGSMTGCADPAPVNLTPEEYQRQKEANRSELEQEDKREAEFQKKQKGS
jgi:hypothetical protein